MQIKKTFTILLLVFLIAVSFSSCQKCYTCVYYGQTGNVYCTKHNSQAELDLLKNSCTQTGGIWSLYNQ